MVEYEATRFSRNTGGSALGMLPPSQWRNIPKCVVTCCTYLLEKTKSYETKIRDNTMNITDLEKKLKAAIV